MKTKKYNIIIGIIVIAIFTAIAYFGMGDSLKSVRQMRYGIDIRGGVEAVFEAQGLTEKPTDEQLDAARNVIESRLDAENIDDREVTVDKQNAYIIVRFPWKSDEKNYNPEDAIAELGDMAELAFKDSSGKVLLEGKNVKSSTAKIVKQNGINKYEVELNFDDKGTTLFADATGSLIGKNMGIYMDDKLISNPKVESKISGGQAVITGMDTYEAATSLSDKINAGALPFSMATTSFSTISPSLGQNALKIMTYSGMLAFAIVCLFMLLYYRLPGLVACLTLLLQMTLQLLAISVPQYTLTLPGMAGLILSLGMSVDANIIIAERISEEIAIGKTLKAAVKSGYKRAFTSVLDGNITTAIAAIILMIFGSGTMLSFGYTLLVGMILNCFVGVNVSKNMLLSLLEYDGCNNEKLFIKKKKRKNYQFYKNKKFCIIISGTLILIGIFGVFTKGVKLDTQFAGGTVLEYSVAEQVDTSKVEAVVKKEISRPVTVQITKNKMDSSSKLVVTLAGNGGISPQQQKAISSEIAQTIGVDNLEVIQSYSVEPYIGAMALKNAITAIIMSFICIVLYVWIRFSLLSGLLAGFTALVALFHDVAMVFFAFVLFGIPLGDAFVAVVLTIIGYSINDTIVVYDRIRENSKIKSGKSISELVDESVTQVLARSINSSLTTTACVVIILIASIVFGINSIYQFSLPMLLGLISGCYSSICIASVLWAMMKEKGDAKKLAAAKIEIAKPEPKKAKN